MHGATIKIAYVVRDVNLVNIFINLSTMELCQMKIRFNFIYSERQLIKMLVNPHWNSFLCYVHLTRPTAWWGPIKQAETCGWSIDDLLRSSVVFFCTYSTELISQMSGMKHEIVSSIIKCYTLAHVREVRQSSAHQYLHVEEVIRLSWL